MADEQIVDDDHNGAPQAVPADQVLTVAEVATPLFREAFRKYGQGERIVFSLTMQALPSPAPPGAPINPETGQPEPMWNSMLMLYAEIHGIVPQTRIFNSWPLMASGWFQAKADTIVQQIMPVLIGYRAQQLEEMTRDAQQAMASGNGNAPPPSGLIVPGRG